MSKTTRKQATTSQPVQNDFFGLRLAVVLAWKRVLEEDGHGPRDSNSPEFATTEASVFYDTIPDKSEKPTK